MKNASTSNSPKLSNLRRRRLLVGFGVGMGVVLIGSATILGYIGHAYAQVIPANVIVAGIEIGGLTPAAAQLKLQTAIDTANSQPIKLTLNDTTITRTTGEMGVQYDALSTMTAALAVGRTPDQIVTAWHELVALFAPPVSVPLQVTFDHAAMASAVAELSTKVGTPTTDAKLLYTKGLLSVTNARAGQMIEVAPLETALTTQLKELLADRQLQATLTAHEPSVSTADAKELLPKLTTFLAAPITLTVPDGVTSTVDAKTTAGWINFASVTTDLDPARTLLTTPRAIHPDSNGGIGGLGQVAAVVNQDVLASYVKSLAAAVDRPAVDAKLTIQNGKATIFTPSQTGQSLKQTDAVTAITTALVARAQTEQSTKPLAITLPVATTNAAITDSTISSLGITQLIGKGTTDFSGSPSNRIHNIQTGVTKLTGVIVKPGDEFSTVGELGAIDGSTGYLPELVILNNKILPQYGGGLCQVSTTLFRAVLNAGLPITERAPHSMQVIYYQRGVGPGLDATVYDPKPDFKFKNDTNSSILVQGSVSGNNLTFELYGTSDGRTSAIDGPHTLESFAPGPDQYQQDDSLQPGEKKTLEHAVPGAKTIATYTVTRNGQQINQQVFKSTYAAMPNIYAEGPKKD